MCTLYNNDLDLFSGKQIDNKARLTLLRHGMNYNHSTGHGVGYFLNVHEGEHMNMQLMAVGQH